MLLQIPNVLSAAQIAECRKALEGAAWSDGKATWWAVSDASDVSVSCCAASVVN